VLHEPTSTYRIQLNKRFDFDAATRLLPYLKELGIDHLYCSPYLQAAPGSTHGYDVVNHTRVNEELGGASGLDRLCTELETDGMRQMLDIVPNHMAITGRENPWWWDVLENGPSSPYAAFFDVDWEPPERRLHNMMLMPVLEDQYGTLLSAGKLSIVREGDSFMVKVGDRVFPLGPRSLRFVLSAANRVYENSLISYLADAFGELSSPGSTDRATIVRRNRDRKIFGAMLKRLLEEDPTAVRAIDQALSQISADKSQLHEVLEAQNYRLAYWRMAARDLGYRRFFDITTLVGLRMENVQVFDATHQLILKWVSEGRLAGLRIDHPDGLRDPFGYLQRLRNACPKTWIVAEKILSGSERLRDSWPIDGSTGYDFMNLVGRVLIDPAGDEPMTSTYRDFSGETADLAAMVRAKKQLAMRGSLGSDINRLTAQFLDVCEADINHRDYSRHDIHEVLRAALACLNVYRTYAREPREIAPEDERLILDTIAAAKTYRPDLDHRLFDFLGEILRLRVESQTAVELAMRFQQVAAAVMAKGLEDTAFYSFNRMIALNDVGGDPATFATTPAAFYQWCREIQKKWPRTMLATSTHDTKRSEDVRARLFVLSELPELWQAKVKEWAELNRQHRTRDFPDRNFEYHLYQNLVGAWPIEEDRMLKYAEKAMREAKIFTSWTDQNEEYESAVRNFIEKLYDDSAFRRSLDDFVAGIVEPGRVNSLTQTLIKLTAPGVPDFYQGCELWDYSLVDPDNRRPVDFECRRALLKQLDGATPEQVMERAGEGLPKLWLVKQGLALRRRHPEWFGGGADFHPMRGRGRRSDHVIAYARAGSVIAVAPRLVVKLGGDWHGTMFAIPEGEWTNRLTGESYRGGAVAMADLLRRFPVALLSRETA
jgi:(1->4)-alpha-D-glucan 1-alpha-D-glucosylmutase